MACYLAVVKHPIDASPAEKRRALTEGLGYIAMALVAEHDYDVEQLEQAMQEAQAEGELELEMKAQREEGNGD
jgi:hypothetical protein